LLSCPERRHIANNPDEWRRHCLQVAADINSTVALNQTASLAISRLIGVIVLEQNDEGVIHRLIFSHAAINGFNER
jgi:hypothetical protein